MARGSGQGVLDNPESILYGDHFRRTPVFLPEMHHVDSSNVSKVGYDSAERSLYIIFKNTEEQESVYVWTDVEEELYQRLMESSSKGQFVHKQVVGQFTSEKIYL